MNSYEQRRIFAPLGMYEKRNVATWQEAFFECRESCNRKFFLKLSPDDDSKTSFTLRGILRRLSFLPLVSVTLSDSFQRLSKI